ncbi:MAG: PilZ domain-containing protein [Acidobacteriia bacterium]|nr:PilZ domain-containing protein [Terriglobia bacterium]
MAPSTEPRVERRQAPRVLYRDLKIVCDGMSDVVFERSPDLTTRGMFINTPRPYPPGAHIRLRFDLVRTRVFVQTVGEVRYCLPGVGVGVHFVELPEYARAAIETELELIKNEEVGSYDETFW